MSRAHVALALVAPALALGGCEPTQTRSARLQREGGGLTEHRGLHIASSLAGVRVSGATVLHDANGTAVVVTLENRTARDLAQVPVAFSVRAGRTVLRNDTPGLDPSLVTAPLLPRGRPTVWVDDQLPVTAGAGAVTFRVGRSDAAVPSRLPRIVLTAIRRQHDADGPYVTGVVQNRSGVTQRRLTIFCVARRGGRIVAAGRGIVDRLPPAPTPKPIRFTIYFIGNPTGAKLGFSAPPVSLS